MAQCRRTTYPPATWCRNPPRPRACIGCGLCCTRSARRSGGGCSSRARARSPTCTPSCRPRSAGAGSTCTGSSSTAPSTASTTSGGPVSATPGRSGWAGWGCGWVSGSSMSTTSSPAGGSICASRRSWLPNPAGCIRAAPQGGEPAHPRAGTDRGRSSTPPSRTWCSPRRYAPPRSWASCWTPIPTPSRPPWVWIATSSPRCCRRSGWSVSTAEGSTGPWPTSPPQRRRSRHEGPRSGCCARQHESDTPTVLREVLVLDRDGLGIDTVGLQLDEAKELLAGVQDIVVDAQVAVAVAAQVGCPHCGAARRHKDTGQVVVRSLFGTLRVLSPRWWHCGCQPHPTRTFRPVAELLPERTTPELAYLQARFAAQASYQVAATLLAEVLPLGRTLHAATVRRHTHAVAQRLEGELGDEQPSFISGCPRDWQQLPRPDLPLIVGLDGGYVHAATQRSRRDGWFEVIAGKAMQANGNPTCFGFVQTYDTKPKRRLFEVLTAHGMAPNQQVTFLTDGGEDIRDLPRMLNPQAEHLLDWFHITMRITVMTNMAKSLCSPPPDPDLPAAPPPDLAADVGGQMESVKWFLWHGNVFRALQIIDELTVALDVAEPSVSEAKLLKAVGEFDSYIRANAERIPNYGERYQAGETISTSFVESAVNQLVSKRMVKKQQMRWTPRGAHLLLQVRVRVLNDQLADDFHRWHPAFTRTPDRHAAAA